jgi:hypothetical protein
LVSSIKVSDLVEKAESAVSAGRYRQAVNIYEEALAEIATEQFPGSERQSAAGRIKSEIERIGAIHEGE